MRLILAVDHAFYDLFWLRDNEQFKYFYVHFSAVEQT